MSNHPLLKVFLLGIMLGCAVVAGVWIAGERSAPALVGGFAGGFVAALLGHWLHAKHAHHEAMPEAEK